MNNLKLDSLKKMYFKKFIYTVNSHVNSFYSFY